MPIFLRQLGPAVAFGIPGVLMFIATVGSVARPQALRDGAARAAESGFVPARLPHGARFGHRADGSSAIAGAAAALGSFLLMPTFGFVIAACLALVAVIGVRRHRRLAAARGARGKHPDEAIDGVRAVLRVLVLFALVTPFWSLFDQKASTWVLQADAMTKPSWFQPSQMQALNPVLVMLLIPFNNLVLYPALRRLRLRADGAAPHDRRHRVLRPVVDRGRRDAARARRRQRVLDHLAGLAVRAPHVRRGAGLRDRPRVRLQPGAARDEGRDHGLLEPVGDGRQPLGAAGERRRARTTTVIDFIKSSGFGVTAFQMFFFAAFAFAAALAFGLVARSYPVADHYRKA